MGLLELTPEAFLQGLFSFIIVVISIVTGLLIALRYFKTKKTTFLAIGLAWGGLISGWIPDGINFILILFNQPLLPLSVYLIIAVGIYPPIVLLWLVGITKLLNVQRRKEYLILYLIFCVIMEIIFFTFLIIDKKGLLGEFLGTFIVDFKGYSMFLLLSSLLIIIGSGLKFAYGALKTLDPKVSLKGKLLLVAFITVSVGIVLDMMLTFVSDIGGPTMEVLLPVMIVITRLIIAMSSIAFYLGYILPKWIETFFLKTD